MCCKSKYLISCFYFLGEMQVYHSTHPSVCMSGRNSFGCLVCVIYYSKSFLSFIFKLFIMIVYVLINLLHEYYLILGAVELRHFYVTTSIRGFIVCEICNSKRFHSFIFKFGIIIVHTLKMCTYYFVFIL